MIFEEESITAMKTMENKAVQKISKGTAWRRMVRDDFRFNKSLYIMILPVILYFVLFCYFPMYGALIAFKDYQPYLGFIKSPFVGLENFRQFFNSPYFWVILKNTLVISFSTLIFGFPAPIILALLLNELKAPRYAKFVQNITYMPHFVSLVVICGMIKTFTLDTGIINTVLSVFGFEPKSLLNYPKYFVPIYVISGIWQEVGWGSIIYLAALTGIDEQLYEAAMIDGAGKWKQLIAITIPGIVPTIVTMLILRVGGILNVGFEKIILLYNDSTASVAEVITSYVYKKGLLDQSWSFSAAAGLFNGVINFVFLIVTNYISKKTTEVGLW